MMASCSIPGHSALQPSPLHSPCTGELTWTRLHFSVLNILKKKQIFSISPVSLLWSRDLEPCGLPRVWSQPRHRTGRTCPCGAEDLGDAVSPFA